MRLLERVLTRAGFDNFISTTDSHEAADLFADFQPDLVLTDWLIVTALAAAAPLLTAQKIVPLEESQKAARTLTATASTLSDLPLKIDGDAEKSEAIRGGEAGILVVPDKNLTATSFKNSGESVTPIAQLWLLKARIAVDGRASAPEKTRTVTVRGDDKSRELQLYFLGLKKNASGAPELLVFSTGREPLLHVPLEQSSNSAEALPIKLGGRKNNEDSGTLTLQIFGQHKAELTLVRAE